MHAFRPHMIVMWIINSSKFKRSPANLKSWIVSVIYFLLPDVCSNSSSTSTERRCCCCWPINVRWTGGCSCQSSIHQRCQSSPLFPVVACSSWNTIRTNPRPAASICNLRQHGWGGEEAVLRELLVESRFQCGTVSLTEWHDHSNNDKITMISNEYDSWSW